MIVLVTGGRGYDDVDRVFEVLDAYGPSIVIEGGARGADRLARQWAIDRGVPYATAEIKAEEAGSVKILGRRLNDALAELYKLAPEAKVTGFHCAVDPFGEE